MSEGSRVPRHDEDAAECLHGIYKTHEHRVKTLLPLKVE